MKLVRACSTLVWMSFQRLLWSSQTLMVMLPLLAGGLFLWWRWRVISARGYDFETAFDRFSEGFVVILFTSFILPICALAYGTTSIGGDREEPALLFLLVRPVPRPLILLAKLAATLPLVLGLVVGSFWIYCRLAGEVGAVAFPLYLPAVFTMTLAYVSLFHLFAVSFRHSTILALVYALFMEFFLGSMPGIINRVAINYYGRSMMYQLGADYGLRPPREAWFQPLAAQTANWALLGIAAGSLLLALVVFQRREYGDLS